jgi:hypothetical protein
MTAGPEVMLQYAPAQISRATVVGSAGGRLVVEYHDGDAVRVECALLHVSAEAPAVPAIGDAVLVWVEPGPAHRGVILGRIMEHGRAGAEGSTTDRADGEDAQPLPDTLVLEARRSLTLRVGDGSITIRHDGKILIKGKDLVSHAQRINRIKGGSVAIN